MQHLQTAVCVGVARGCTHGRENSFRVIYRGNLLVHPRQIKKSIFEEIIAGRGRFGGWEWLNWQF